MMIRSIVSLILVIAGLCFSAISATGVLRLKDFYSRLHSSGVGETAGLTCVCLGLLVYEGFTTTGAKLVMIFIVAMLGNPIGTHILGRVSYHNGYRPWEGGAAAEIEEVGGHTRDAVLKKRAARKQAAERQATDDHMKKQSAQGELAGKEYTHADTRN